LHRFYSIFFTGRLKNENLGNATDILDSNNNFGMALPKTCSFRDNYIDCPLPPSYIISVVNNGEEYMIAVVCQDHRDKMEEWLKAMQSVGKIPQGNIKFDEIKLVVTDCIRDSNDNF
jgi:hypothetical protein